MKKILTTLITVIPLVFCLTSSAQAELKYYTFTGTVTRTDNGGNLSYTNLYLKECL
jgi:hypothetical protein